jgi:hypothetical protein
MLTVCSPLFNGEEGSWMSFLDILGNSIQSFYEFLMTCFLEIIIDLRMLLTCLLFDAKLMAT